MEKSAEVKSFAPRHRTRVKTEKLDDDIKVSFGSFVQIANYTAHPPNLVTIKRLFLFLSARFSNKPDIIHRGALNLASQKAM